MQRLTLQIGRTRRRRGEFATDDERRLQYIDDPLHLEWLYKIATDLGVIEQFLADALDCKRRSKNPSLKRPVGPVAPE